MIFVYLSLCVKTEGNFEIKSSRSNSRVAPLQVIPGQSNATTGKLSILEMLSSYVLFSS